LQDNAGTKVVSYAIGFTTAAPVDPIISFQKLPQTVTSGVGFTAVVVGPDHMLYGGSDDGRIFRFPIGAEASWESRRSSTHFSSRSGAATAHGDLL
jgi:hypothetical protein